MTGAREPGRLIQQYMLRDKPVPQTILAATTPGLNAAPAGPVR